MQVTITELLANVRALLDADEIAPGRWAPDSMLVAWLNHGTVRLWRKLARAGRVQPIVTSVTYPAASTLLIGGDKKFDPNNLYNEPLVIYGVSEVTDQGPRMLKPAQSGLGPIPYPVQTGESGPAQYWSVVQSPADAGLGIGKYIISLYPAPTSGTYAVQWLEKPVHFTADAGGDGGVFSLDIPAGMEEYPVLYAARRALTRAGAAPPSIAAMLNEMDQELDLAADQLLSGNAPRVINKDRELRGWARRGQDTPTSTWGYNWVWFA